MDQRRRELLKLCATALAVNLLPIPGLAASLKDSTEQRRLSFYHIHTNETIDLCYFDDGNYCPDALKRINHALRDHRTKEEKPIDIRLLDILHALKVRMGTKAPFNIISGYRSPSTNTMLWKTTSGVARTSFHTEGRAIDIRLPGYDTRRLRNVCVAMNVGGVGYYRDSDFVHLDTGPVRNW